MFTMAGVSDPFPHPREKGSGYARLGHICLLVYSRAPFSTLAMHIFILKKLQIYFINFTVHCHMNNVTVINISTLILSLNFCNVEKLVSMNISTFK